MIPKAQLDEHERLGKEATQGRVSIERRDDDDGSIDFIIHGRGDVAACFETANANARANAAKIEALWNSAGEYLAEVRLLHKVREFFAMHGEMLQVALNEDLSLEDYEDRNKTEEALAALMKEIK